jgi:hypothetical protein
VEKGFSTGFIHNFCGKLLIRWDLTQRGKESKELLSKKKNFICSPINFCLLPFAL